MIFNFYLAKACSRKSSKSVREILSVYFNLKLHFGDKEFPTLASSPFLAMTFSSQLESLFTILVFKSGNYYWEKEFLNAKREAILVKMTQWWTVIITDGFDSLFIPVSLDLNLRVWPILPHIYPPPEGEVESFLMLTSVPALACHPMKAMFI